LQSTLPSPADYQAFIAAHPQLNLEFPATAEERARLAPAVIAWKRQQNEQRGPDAGDIAAAGLGLAGLGAGGYALWRLFGSDPAVSAAKAAGDRPLPPRQVDPVAAMGATEATRRENYVGSSNRRPDAPARPVTGSPLVGVDQRGSDTARLMGAFSNNDTENLLNNPVISGFLKERKFDEAKQYLARILGSKPEQLRRAVAAVDYYSGQKSEVQKTFRAKIGKLGEGPEARIVIQEVDDDGRTIPGALIDPNKEWSNTTIKVEMPIMKGDQVVGWEPRFFSNGSNASSRRQWRSLNAEAVAAEGKARARDNTVPTDEVPGAGRYKAGTNLAPIERTINATNPFAPATTGGDIKATSATDPLRQDEGMLNLNTSRGSSQKAGPDNYTVMMRPAPAPGGLNPTTGHDFVMVPLQVRTVGDLPEEARKGMLMQVVEGTPGAMTRRLVPVEGLSADTPVLQSTEFYQKGREDRPRFRVEGQGELREYFRDELSNTAMPLADKFSGETQAPFNDYNARSVRYGLLNPNALMEAVTPAIGAKALSRIRQGKWVETPPKASLTPAESRGLKQRGASADEVNQFLAEKQATINDEVKQQRQILRASALKIARAGLRSRELQTSKFNATSPVNLFTYASAALRGLGIPESELNGVVRELGDQVAAGKHREFDQQPLPFRPGRDAFLNRGDLPVVGPEVEQPVPLVSKFDDMPLLVGEQFPVEAQAPKPPRPPVDPALAGRPAIGIGRYAVDDIESGLHSEPAASKPLVAARTAGALLRSDGGSLSDESYAEVQQLADRLGVNAQQIIQTGENVQASLNRSRQQRAIPAEQRRAALKRSYAIGSRSASDIWLAAEGFDMPDPKIPGDGRAAYADAVESLRGGDDELARQADGAWKDRWIEQATSALAEAPRLKEVAAREAVRTGLAPDIKAVASTYARQIPKLVETFSGELQGLPLATQYGIVGEAMSRAIEDYPAAIKWAAQSQDPAIRKLAEQAVQDGKHGHFEFELFARQYVGNAVSLMTVAERSDGTNPAPLQIGEDVGAEILSRARLSGRSVEEVLGEELRGASSQSAAIIRLRDRTKGTVGALPRVPGRKNEEPYTNGAVLANAFMTAPETDVAGTAVGRLRYGDGDELGFDRPSIAPVVRDDKGVAMEGLSGAGASRFPVRLVFSSKAAENRGLNEGSLMEGQIQSLSNPVRSATIQPRQEDFTAVAGSSRPQRDALELALDRFGAKRSQQDTLESFVSPGVDADSNPVRGTSESRSFLAANTGNVDTLIKEVGRRQSQLVDKSPEWQELDKERRNLERQKAHLEKHPNSTALRMAQLNTDADVAQGRTGQGFGGLVIDLAANGQPSIQRLEGFRGGTQSLEAMQEASGDSVFNSGAMVGTDRLSEMAREGQTAGTESAEVDIAVPGSDKDAYSDEPATEADIVYQLNREQQEKARENARREIAVNSDTWSYRKRQEARARSQQSQAPQRMAGQRPAEQISLFDTTRSEAAGLVPVPFERTPPKPLPSLQTAEDRASFAHRLEWQLRDQFARSQSERQGIYQAPGPALLQRMAAMEPKRQEQAAQRRAKAESILAPDVVARRYR
jgi:hypothetical protein